MSSTSVPFAFEHNGFFARPQLDFVMTVFAVEQFKNYQPKNEKERVAVEDLLNFATHLMKDSYARFLVSEQKSGDFPTSKKGVPQDWMMYLTIPLPAAFRQNYYPNHQLSITSNNPRNWGWAHAETLMEHATTLRSIAKQLDCNLKFTPIKKAAEWYNKLGTELSVREPNSLSDVGRTSGFASYIEDAGYIDAQGYPNTLSKARLFPNADEARKFASKAIAVEIEIGVKHVCDPTSDQRLIEAVGLLQKERLQEALEKAEIEVLRQRLKDLGYDTVENPTAKRKL